MLLQELSGKDQERVAEVSAVRVELQEQIGHLHAERTAQGALKEKISALEREMKSMASLIFQFILLYSLQKCNSLKQLALVFSNYSSLYFSTTLFLSMVFYPPVLNSNHREMLLDKESQMSSMMEKLRLKDLEIQRMREDEAHRAQYLQNAILTYVQRSPLGHINIPKK